MMLLGKLCSNGQRCAEADGGLAKGRKNHLPIFANLRTFSVDKLAQISRKSLASSGFPY
jgi:hypothetical protein